MTRALTQVTAKDEHHCAAGGKAVPRALGAKPKNGGLETVHFAAPGRVAGNVDELGVHDQLQNHRQQLKPGSCPSCTEEEEDIYML